MSNEELNQELELHSEEGNEEIIELQSQISEFETGFEGNADNESKPESEDPGNIENSDNTESIVATSTESTEELLYDSWYASFDDHPPDPDLEVVIGNDDRKRIRNTSSYPFRVICSLKMESKTGKRYIGTGWLISPRTVITAGHCVYFHKEGGWPKSIEVIPGRDARSTPFGSAKATSFRSVRGWTRRKKRKFDYGAIILPEYFRIGDQIGYFGFARLSDDSLMNKILTLSGYPGDKPSGTHWYHSRKTESVNADVITYDIDSFGGQSGSPVWYQTGNQLYGVGIHTNGHSGGNSATRINKSVYKNLVKWKNLGQ